MTRVCVAAVPRFVLDRIVEQPRLALLPVAHFVADAERALPRHQQRQVTDQSRVHQAVVRRNVRAGLQQRKQDRRRAIRHARQRHVLQRLHGARTTRGILRHDLAVLPQIEGAPRRIVQHARLLVRRTVALRLHVRRERGGLLHHSLQLGADGVGLALQRVQPRERLALVELDLRQAREIEVTRLLQVDPLPAEHDIQGLREALAAGRRVEAARRQLIDDVLLILARIALVHRARPLQVGQQVARRLLRRTGRLQRREVVGRGRARVAGVRKVIRLEDQGANVARLRGEHLFDLVDVHERDCTSRCRYSNCMPAHRPNRSPWPRIPPA